MTYLYGDSSDSGLELNYIELLRDFLDFAVQVMLSEHRIAAAHSASDDHKRQVSAELDRLRGLGATVASALEKAKSPNPTSSTDQSIAALHRATEDTLRRAAEALKSAVVLGEQQLATTRNRERAANTKLIERLLLNHELPDSQNTVDLRLNDQGSGYEAEIVGSCAQGLTWRFQARIVKGNRFEELVKVGTLRPDMTIELPEMSGFVRKSVKLKSYKLAAHFVTDLVHEGQDLVLKLRSSTQPDDVTGLDIRFSPTAPKVTIVRSQKGEESPVFHVPEGDAETLTALCKELVLDATPLVAERSKLLEVSFNKFPLRDCPDPAVMIQRLVARIGPVIQSIAAHSLADTELILKRVLANGRREEIFASKAELLDKLSSVPPDLRIIFAPLGLGNMETEVGDYDPTNRVDAMHPAARPVARTSAPLDAPTMVPNTPSNSIGLTANEASGSVSPRHQMNADEEEEEATNVVEGLTHEITADAADELPERSPRQRKALGPMPFRPKSPSSSPTHAAPPAATKPTAERISKTIRSPNPPQPPASPAKNQSSGSLDSIDVALAELEADN